MQLVLGQVLVDLEPVGVAEARGKLVDTHAEHVDRAHGAERPEPESYRGSVSTTGPRACYDESKRFAEAATTTFARSFGVDACIARIFNTYGPRIRPDDGRVVSNFVVQALDGQPITIYGDGRQTRSFCYVEDEAAGLVALLDSGVPGPMNLGNPDESTVEELALHVIELTGSDSTLVRRPLPQDDPTQRRPDITLATEVLGWSPRVPLREGLRRTIEHLRAEVRPGGNPIAGRVRTASASAV